MTGHMARETVIHVQRPTRELNETCCTVQAKNRGEAELKKKSSDNAADGGSSAAAGVEHR